MAAVSASGALQKLGHTVADIPETHLRAEAERIAVDSVPADEEIRGMAHHGGE
jgi:hypothetical protein